jgi:hypothetical protein
MSRRVTTKTAMTDGTIVAAAAKQQGFDTNVVGNTVHFLSGSLRGAVLDLRTGNITGDTDYGHTATGLKALVQGYGEAKVRAEIAKQGGYVEQRMMEGDKVVLICQIG